MNFKLKKALKLVIFEFETPVFESSRVSSFGFKLKKSQIKKTQKI